MSDFRKAHYNTIALLLKENREATQEDLLEAFVKLFKADNPNFDPQRFREACNK